MDGNLSLLIALLFNVYTPVAFLDCDKTCGQNKFIEESLLQLAFPRGKSPSWWEAMQQTAGVAVGAQGRENKPGVEQGL